MRKDRKRDGASRDRRGYRPLNGGYSADEECAHLPGATSGTLPKAPRGTGQTPVPTSTTSGTLVANE